MVRKIFFCSEFPVIPEKWWRKEEEEKQLRSILLFKHKCNKCFFDYLNLSFILIYTLDAIKNNSFELNKNLFRKHSIRTFKRHTFDSIIDQAQEGGMHHLGREIVLVRP